TTALLSPVEFMKATVDGMVQRGWGRVVNISTAAAKYPTEVRLLSGPPRAALSNYTAAVARKVARHNVAINNVLPGMFHTAATADRFTALAARNGTTYDEEVQKFAKDWRIPARRFGDPDELGALVALLCSQYAGFTVGQSFVVDGGIGIGTF
ncbi:MAG: SDR family oxidoreductase, partial [SAR202 cluster bacterium]|nr:SDR family oxidoreductase [SAR202 cluster bacterium]